MPTLPVIAGVDSPPQAVESLEADLVRAADYAASAKAASSRRAYQSDFRHFAAWCAANGGQQHLPASVRAVAAYLAFLADAGRKASTIARRCAAIAYAHRLAAFETPTTAEPVKAVLRGIRRRIGTAPVRKAPATAKAIAGMLRRIPETPAGLRDRALLLIGFSAALRRSELVALDVGDIEVVDAGVIVHVRRGKTDQEGAGAEIAIPKGSRLRPVEALNAWLAVCANAQTETNACKPLFVSIAKGNKQTDKRLSDRAVALIVKRWAASAKLDPALFAGHSLRAGFVTSALDAGADTFKIMDVTRHRRVETLRIYDRRSKAFKDHAGKGFL